MSKRSTFYWILALVWPLITVLPVSAQVDYPGVGPMFSCNSLNELQESFKVANTYNAKLREILYATQTKPLTAANERELIIELLKDKPWRESTIPELEAEFSKIRDLYEADRLEEGEARLQYVCALSKYLHRDYLLNFKKEGIFASNPKAYQFYEDVIANNLWQNLRTPDRALLENENNLNTDQPATSSESNRTSDRQVTPERRSNNNSSMGLLTFLFWIIVILGAWILLSLFLGGFWGDLRFKNKNTQAVLEVLLIPFNLIYPAIISRKEQNSAKAQAVPNPGSKLEGSDQDWKSLRMEEAPTTGAGAELLLPIKERIDALEQRLQHIGDTPVAPPPGSEAERSVGRRLGALETQLQKNTETIHLIAQQQESRTKDQTAKDSWTREKLVELFKQFSTLENQLNQRLDAIEQKLNTESHNVAPETAPEPITRQEEAAPEEPEEPEEEQEDLPVEPEPKAEIPAAEIQDETIPVAPVEAPASGGSGEVRFATSPQRGLFYGRRLVHDFIPKETVYKIMIEPGDPTTAGFTLVEDEATLRLAFNIPDNYILPAMELRGTGKLNDARKIGPIVPGILKKEGENWKIVQKGILHYE